MEVKHSSPQPPVPSPQPALEAGTGTHRSQVRGAWPCPQLLPFSRQNPDTVNVILNQPVCRSRSRRPWATGAPGRPPWHRTEGKEAKRAEAFLKGPGVRGGQTGLTPVTRMTAAGADSVQIALRCHEQPMTFKHLQQLC